MKQINQFNTILRPTKIWCNNNLNNPAIIGEESINISCGLHCSIKYKNNNFRNIFDWGEIFPIGTFVIYIIFEW